MGAISWWTWETCLPLFEVGRIQYAMSTPHFLFRFCIWRGSKNKSDVCHVLREVLFLLDITQNQVDVERGFQVSLDTCVVSLSLISLDSVKCINFNFNRMISSIFQVSVDRERWFTASVRHFTLCSILSERLFS